MSDRQLKQWLITTERRYVLAGDKVVQAGMLFTASADWGRMEDVVIDPEASEDAGPTLFVAATALTAITAYAAATA